MLRSRPAKVVLLLLTAGAVAFYLILDQAVYVPPEIDQASTALTDEDAEQALTTASQLEAQVRQLKKASEQGMRAPFTMVITEAQANAYLQTNQDISGSGAPVRKARVRFGEGIVTLMGIISAAGRDWYVEIDGAVRPADGSSIAFEPQEVRIGRLELPGAVRERIMRQVREQAGGNLIRLPAEIEQVVVHSGRMVVTGRTK